MAFNKIDMGPKLDLTRDHLIYDRYRDWKQRVKMLMASAFEGDSEKVQCNYLKYWLGEEGLHLIRKWEGTGKLTYTGADPSGFKHKTLEIFLKNSKQIDLFLS